jgi:hypothetical protein
MLKLDYKSSAARPLGESLASSGNPMTHFLLLVISDEPLTPNQLNTVLLPWRDLEYEDIDCDYYVDIDETERLRTEFMASARAQSGGGPDPSLLSFPAWAQRRMRLPVVDEQGAILSDASGGIKHGRIVVDAHGEVIEIIRRTNPNAKWDWYQQGGHYSDMLIVDDLCVDEARFGDLDIDAMKAERESARRMKVQKIFRRTDIPADQRDAVLSELRIARRQAGELAPSLRDEALQEWIACRFSDMCAQLSSADPDGLLDDVTGDIAAWIADAPYLSCWAIVCNGQWLECGSDEEQWRQTVTKILGELAPDQHLCVVDCHR